MNFFIIDNSNVEHKMLSLESRNYNDLRTIGDLFFYLFDEAEDIKFSTSLMLIIELLRKFSIRILSLVKKSTWIHLSLHCQRSGNKN